MERIRALNGYQKGVLAVLLAMIVVFTILYPITINRVGYLYNDTILVPSEKDETTVYSGKISGQKTAFTVSDDGTVVLQHGDKTYGPYTVTEDPAAIPEKTDREWIGEITGVEIRCGEEIVFRGCVEDFGDSNRWLFEEDGSAVNLGFRASSGGVVWDENGDVVDPLEPTVLNILDLVEGPELVHKGSWMGWFLGVLVCAITAAMVLFADELFRWNLRFRIRDVEGAEPSEWEIMGRYVSWTVLGLAALFAFIVGLTEAL